MIKLADDVKPFAPEDLLRRVVVNLAAEYRHRRNRKRAPFFWCAVKDATSLGSTCSAGIARWAGFDPDTGIELENAKG